MSGEEWGPWIEWGGRMAIPPGVRVGDYYQGLRMSGQSVEKRVERNHPLNWSTLKRFRIRKPKGLTMLEGLIQNLPVPTKELERT